MKEINSKDEIKSCVENGTPFVYRKWADKNLLDKLDFGLQGSFKYYYTKDTFSCFNYNFKSEEIYDLLSFMENKNISSRWWVHNKGNITEPHFDPPSKNIFSIWTIMMSGSKSFFISREMDKSYFAPWFNFAFGINKSIKWDNVILNEGDLMYWPGLVLHKVECLKDNTKSYNFLVTSEYEKKIGYNSYTLPYIMLSYGINTHNTYNFDSNTKFLGSIIKHIFITLFLLYPILNLESCIFLFFLSLIAILSYEYIFKTNKRFDLLQYLSFIMKGIALSCIVFLIIQLSLKFFLGYNPSLSLIQFMCSLLVSLTAPLFIYFKSDMLMIYNFILIIAMSFYLNVIPLIIFGLLIAISQYMYNNIIWYHKSEYIFIYFSVLNSILFSLTI